jgi:hypothetical protein
MANAKGSALVGAVKFLRSRREDALRLLAPELRHYLDDRIQISSWYPEQDLLSLIRAVAPLLPVRSTDVYETMGRAIAREHMGSTYAHLLREADELALPRRALVLWQSMHDTGQMTLKVEEPGHARIDVLGYALPSREICGTVTGYMRETLGIAGLKDPIVMKTACRAGGKEACTWRATWQPKAEA